MYLKVGDETNTEDFPQNQTMKIKKQNKNKRGLIILISQITNITKGQKIIPKKQTEQEHIRKNRTKGK
jgi:hypothetical protein